MFPVDGVLLVLAAFQLILNFDPVIHNSLPFGVNLLEFWKIIAERNGSDYEIGVEIFVTGF